MSEPQLRCEKAGATGLLVLSNVARRNAITSAMWRAIPGALAAFEADPEVHCIVLRGEGTQAFAAGADISEFEQQRANASDIAAYDEAIDRALHALEATAKPVIALIHGYCLGGGMELALACDLRYCGASAQFAIPAARLGVGYGVHGTNRLLATVGHGAAREILFTARRYSASEALDLGIVQRVLPDAELEAHVAEVAHTLADNAPLAIAASKATIEALIAATGNFAAAGTALTRCRQSEDYVEGRRAFMAKRAPRFRGR